MREYLKFYIDGKWVDPVEPKTLEVDNPTTEQVSGRISLGSAADVDKAVKAARQAFAHLVAEQPGRAPGPAAGDPRRIPEARRRPRRRGERGDGRAGLAGSGPPGRPRHWPPGERHRRAEELSLRGTARRDAGDQGADRRLRPDHAVELADQPDRLQGGPGAGDRLHHGAETVGSRAVLRPDLHRDRGRRRCAGRGVQPGLRRRPRCGRGAVEPSRHRHGLVHRFHPRRRRRRPQRRADGEARDPGAGRQEPEHRPRRLGLRQERRRRRGRHDAQLRPELQRAIAHAGAERPQGRSHRGRPRGRRAGDGRRPRRQAAPSDRWSRRRSSTRSRA